MQGKVAVPGRIAGSAERRGSITPRIDEAPQGKSEDGHHLPLPPLVKGHSRHKTQLGHYPRALARALPAEVNTI
jgi:hypothetical protein